MFKKIEVNPLVVLHKGNSQSARVLLLVKAR
ncbi:hypothetical protein GGGNBK_17645 [Sporosarcina sp. ANT_H38]